MKMQLTVRSYTDEVRRQLLDGIRQIAEDTSRTFGCAPPEVVLRDEFTPTAYNDPQLTAAAADLFRQIFGADHVREMPPGMGGEDFGRYAKHLEVPGLMFRVGVVSAEDYAASQQPGGPRLPAIHSPGFAPVHEESLETSVTALANLALGILAKE